MYQPEEVSFSGSDLLAVSSKYKDLVSGETPGMGEGDGEDGTGSTNDTGGAGDGGGVKPPDGPGDSGDGVKPPDGPGDGEIQPDNLSGPKEKTEHTIEGILKVSIAIILVVTILIALFAILLKETRKRKSEGEEHQEHQQPQQDEH